VKRYEELEGGVGREIFFRPQRYHAPELEPLSLWAELSTAQGPMRLDVLDLSQGGVALACPERSGLMVGEEVELRVGFDDQLAYEGSARVRVARPYEGERLSVGFDLRAGLIKLDELLQTRDLKRYHSEGASFKGASSAWRVVGHEAFKSQVGELKLWLDDWRAHFNELEREVSWELLRHEPSHPTRRALLSLVRQDFMPDFSTQAGALFELTRHLSVEEQGPLKAFSQRYLDADFMSAPWMHRARVKPLGYPGDYEVMNHIYGERLEGRTLLGQALNYTTLQSPAAAAVRNRKDMMKRELKALFDTGEGAFEPLSLTAEASVTPVRVLSVAAGPAQETFEVLSELDHLPRPLEVVLFDQDPGALAFAYGRLKALADQKFKGQLKLIYLHDSIRRLLNDQALFEGFGPFDLVLCSGLYDYLRHSTAVKLTAQMYAHCKPGGQVLIGNMVHNNASRWIMEHHLEWTLLYRTHEEMLAFAGEGAPSASLRIITEPTGVNPFVGLTRPL
jgi:extracellular factor (EF) 3-hydroxypalmitic acid methyl ester biosynthesis protein